MLLSTQTAYLNRRFGDEQAIRMLAAGGFDAIDLTLYDVADPEMAPWWDNHRKYAAHLRDVAKESGISINQAHAPFRFKEWGNPEVLEHVIYPAIIRAMEAAAIAGAKIIVVHPLRYSVYKGHEKEIRERNMEHYRKLIPYCEEFGIKVALENMFLTDVKRGCKSDDICSSPEEYIGYLEELDSPWITGCLDTGHCGLAGREAQDMIRAIGGRYIQALHVQDNNYVEDSHQLPYMGKLDWDEITAALGEVGYEGDFTFEASNFIRGVDDELLPTAIRYMHDTGRLLIRKIDSHRKE